MENKENEIDLNNFFNLLLSKSAIGQEIISLIAKDEKVPVVHLNIAKRAIIEAHKDVLSDYNLDYLFSEFRKFLENMREESTIINEYFN